MKKILLVLSLFVVLFFGASCAVDMPSFGEYEAELTKKGLKVEMVPSEKITNLVSSYLENIPDVALPSEILISGDFTEKLDIEAYLDGTKEFDPVKFSNEVKGIVINFNTQIMASLVMGYEDDVRQAFKDNNIELDPSIKIVSKGGYIFIGYQEFLDSTYNYVSEPTSTPNDKTTEK